MENTTKTESIPQPVPTAAATTTPTSTSTPDSGPLPVPSTVPPAPSAPAPDPLSAVSRSIGQVQLRSAAQEVAYRECEEIIRSGWATFVQVGLALARIRDEELYCNDFNSFEEYCRERWGYQHSHVYRLIAAAQVSKELAVLPGVPQPDHESQLRPLVGLEPMHAQMAWQYAVGISRDAKVTPRLLKLAIKTLNLAAPVPQAPNKQQRYEHRAAIRAGFNDLLSSLLQKAAHDVLLDKVQALQRHVNALLGGQKKPR